MCIAISFDELLEVVGARDEVGLAVHLDEHADLAAHVDVVADQPLGGRAAGLLGRLREPALAQERRRLLEVAVGLGQRRLALHHARAGRVAELLHHRCRNFHVAISCSRSAASTRIVPAR